MDRNTEEEGNVVLCKKEDKSLIDVINVDRFAMTSAHRLKFVV